MPESRGATPVIGLKIDVDTLRGTREGVPALVDSLKKFSADATFYFSVGPDHTGRAIRRVFRPGFMQKVARTSVVKHYGLKTLMYGVLLPGPHIGRKAGAHMRAARDAGFEVGVHTFDHIRWQDHVAGADAQWTRREFERALQAFSDVFGFESESHAAAGWQMNAHALALEAEHGLLYASDTRGTAPFLPRLAGAPRVPAPSDSRGDRAAAADAPDRVTGGVCPQLPTTLPTFDELLGRDGIDENNIADAMFARWERLAPTGPQVFTLHAELEGMLLRKPFETLLDKWARRGVKLERMKSLYRALDPNDLPTMEVAMREIDGRSGLLATQAGASPAPA